MGKWESELMLVAEQSAKNKKMTDEKLKVLLNAVEAAQMFVSAMPRMCPRSAKPPQKCWTPSTSVRKWRGSS